MFLAVLSEIPFVLGHLEVWLGGAFWGLLMLWSLNFLAYGYTGSRSLFQTVMSQVVFIGIGLFFLFAGPTIVFGSTLSGQARTFGVMGLSDFRPSRALITFAIGLLFAFLTRIIFRPRLSSAVSRIWRLFIDWRACQSTL